MKKIRVMPLYLVLIVLDFYLLPLWMNEGNNMIMLLVIVPLICFTCSIIYGVKNSFNIFYAIIVAILFTPSIFIFYNSSAWVYIVGYGIIALAGNSIGAIFFKRIE